MQDRSTMTMAEYRSSIFWKVVIGFVWYKGLLFRTLLPLGTRASLVVLAGVLVGVAFLFALVFNGWRNGWMSTAAVSIPLGLYTAIVYWRTIELVGAACLLSAIALSVAYSVRLMTARIKRKNRRRIRQNRALRCLYVSTCIWTACMAVLMISIGWYRFFGTSFMATSVPPVADDVGDTMSDHQEEILKLQPEVWAQQNTKQRLDILQTVCNIEVAYLGLTTPVTVEAELLPEILAGAYADETRLVQIDLDHLERDSVKSVLKTVLHEVHHSYEYRLADAYQSASPEDQQLLLFRAASQYTYETKHYIDADDDYWGYASQVLELDSDLYAEFRAEEYYERIDMWLEDTNEDIYD